MAENKTSLFEFGEYSLDPSEHRLLRQGDVVPLTPKALELLCVLVEQNGHLFEKSYLMERLWADAFVEEGNLADNISKIRQALGDSRKEPKFIETVSGRGYRFIADVKRVEAKSTGAVEIVETSRPTGAGSPSFFQASLSELYSERKLPDPSANRGTVNSDNRATQGTIKVLKPIETRVERRWRLYFLFGAVLLPILVLAVYFWTDGERGQPNVTTTRSIAVLPFKPLVAAARDEALELGMSDSLISGLSRLRQITVRPISSVRRYVDLEQDSLAAGRELDVEAVLEGNIQRTGERIRISARLVRVKDGVAIWSETFDEKFTNIFAVQDAISQRIVGALALQLTGDERNTLARQPTTDTAAYQLYTKGRFFWSKLSPDDLKKSVEFYEQAIEIDPNYALAYAGLADSYNLLGSYGVWPIKESHPKARAAAEKALNIDPNLAEAHASLGAVIADYYWDWAAAEEHFKRAIQLNPNYPVARNWYSQYLARMGQLEESVGEARRAQELEPLSSSANSHVGLALYRARRFDEAAAELNKALELDSDAMDAHIFLGFVFVEQRKTAEAVQEFRSVVEISNRNPSMMALLAYGHAIAGDRQNAHAILKEFGSDPNKSPVSKFETAMIYIALGERDLAFKGLEQAIAQRAWQMGFLKVEPVFDPLRSDPRFEELMRSTNLAP